jgi:glycerate dehydrogenase
LDRLTANSDVISLHCPLTDMTRGMVDSDFLRQCKSSLLLINASRGALINESDLVEALRTGTIAAAAVDVVSREPIEPDNPLLNAPNCVITPHMAWASLAARRRLLHTTVENVRAFVDGAPQNVVNRFSLDQAT